MRRSCSRVAGTLPAGMVLAIAACGQSLVEPERIPEVRKLLEAQASAPQLRCEIEPVRPALDFRFRFHAGYTADIPLAQIRGSGHHLTFYARVTPEGREPVYMTKTEVLPEVPETKVEAVTGGGFVVGEGTYSLEVLVEDDLHRNCRGSWRVQARRAGSERQLNQTLPPGTVEELSGSRTEPADAKHGPRIGRLTVLLHAAPLAPNLSSLQPDDVQRVVDSLSSLLRELPAQSVRLIAFNLDQRTVIFHKDGFDVEQNGELTAALNQLELGLLDYKAMRDRPEPMDLLLGLVQAELRGSNPPDALIVIGPRTRVQADFPPDALGKHPLASFPIFDLQLRVKLPLPPGRGPNSRVSAADAMTRPGPQLTGAPISRGAFLEAEDPIERLVSRLKGQIIPVRVPHDLADAIQHMGQRIAKSAAPAVETAIVERPAKVGAPAPQAVPPAAVSPSVRGAVPETASAGEEDPVLVLMRLRDQVVEHGEQTPNHTCVESIQRDRYEPTAGRAPKSCDALLARRKQGDFQARLKLDSTDWLRLDVAYANGNEIYSWAGASKFEEGDLDELVPEGAMGTGPFASMLLSIFESRIPKFIFEGETTVEGRRLFEYSFAVAQEQSHYRVKARKEWIVTGYTGTLLLDPGTSELVRLVVRTEELPPATSACEADTTLEYGVVQLGGGDYLLPKVARQRFIGREGAEAENAMTFSACREYQAESNVAFGVGAHMGGGQAVSPAPRLVLPAGLPVTVELVTPVRFGQAAAGDVIEGRVARPIRDERKTTLIEEGTAVQGRLMRVEAGHARGMEHTVALRWEAVQNGGVTVPLSLVPNRRAGALRTGVGNVLRSRGMAIELPLPSESRYGVFHLPGGREVLESGFRTEWFTAEP